MKVSEKLMAEIMKALNVVVEKHNGVIDSYRFKFTLVSDVTELTLRLREMTDAEVKQLSKDGKK